ncbi:MAG: hypothetical protein WC551_05980 [Patescibacteria group bacterium]
MTNKAQIILDLLLNNVERDETWSPSLACWREKAQRHFDSRCGGLPPPGFREACLEAARELANLGIEVGEKEIRAALSEGRSRRTRLFDDFGRPKRLPPSLDPDSSLRRAAFGTGFTSIHWFGPCSARG